MSKDDRPCIEFYEPDKEQIDTLELKKFNGYELWMSVQKIEGHEKAISEEYIQKLGDEKNLYSVFHAIWIPKLYFKDEYDCVCLKVNYRTTDEGTTDSVEKIKPFELSKADNN